jgi:hypothetical protein
LSGTWSQGEAPLKEDVERYQLGHAGKNVHAGYGKQWIKTLKAAVEIIPNPASGATLCRRRWRSAAC